MAQVYGLTGLVNVPEGAITGSGAPPASFRGQLGQQYFDISNAASPVQYTFNGVAWQTGGNAYATTSAPGIVTLSANVTTDAASTTLVPYAKAVYDYGQSLVLAGANIAQTSVTGITNLATDVQAVAGTATVPGVTALAVQPSNLAAVFAAPPAAGFGSGTPRPVAATFISATAVGTGNILTSDTASSFGVTGAGIDVTLSSNAGRVVVNGEEAAADAVRILSAAGGVDLDAALQVNIASSQNAVDAIRIVASAGGIDIDAVGAATEDINITNTGGSVVIVATESVADAIRMNASGAAGGFDIDAGSNGFIVDTTGGISLDSATASNFTATGVANVTISSTGGRVIVDGGQAVANAITVVSAAGGIDADAALQINVASSQAAATALRFIASDAAGGIDVDAGTGGIAIDTTGALSLDSATTSNFTVTGAGADLNLLAAGGSILVEATEDAALAIRLHANGGTSETIQIHADQGTGVASIGLLSDVGGITVRSSALASADAINLEAAAGGVDVDAALQINIASSQAAATAIRLVASDAAGGFDIDSGTGGIIIDSTGAISLDGAAASNFSVTGAGVDLTLASASGSIPISAGEAIVNAIGLQAAAGGIDIDAALQISVVTTEANANSMVLASAGGLDITATGGAASDIDIVCTSGSINLTAGEAIATSMVITNNGMDIVVAGAAGRDIDITNTGGSINITATENATDAIVITASGAASAFQVDAGTGSFRIGTGIVVAATPLTFASTPYTVLGTDYFLACDTSAGALTVTLPAASALAGRTFVIRDVGGAAAVNNITIGGGGTNLVGGGAAAATKLLSANYSGATVYSDGTVWAYSYVA